MSGELVDLAQYRAFFSSTLFEGADVIFTPFPGLRLRLNPGLQSITHFMGELNFGGFLGSERARFTLSA